ncbi:MAG: ribonuclease Z [Candidatus Woesearchaeota archaeon]
MIKLVALGTSSMTPTEKRNHPGFFLMLQNLGILLDCGEGTQRQIRLAKIRPSSIDYIFITHWHGDHTLGLPGLFQMLAANNYKNTLKIIGPKTTKKRIEQILKIFEFTSPISLEVIEIDENSTIDLGNFYCKTIKLLHSIETYAYIFYKKSQIKLDKEKLQKYNLSIESIKKLKNGEEIIHNGKKITYKDVGLKTQEEKIFAYVTDTLYFDKLINSLKDVQNLLIECTYSAEDYQKASEFFHLSLKDVVQLANEIMPKNLILTHFSQRYKDDDKFNKLMMNYLKENLNKGIKFYLSKDFDVFSFTEKE